MAGIGPYRKTSFRRVKTMHRESVKTKILEMIKEGQEKTKIEDFYSSSTFRGFGFLLPGFQGLANFSPGLEFLVPPKACYLQTTVSWFCPNIFSVFAKTNLIGYWESRGGGGGVTQPIM